MPMCILPWQSRWAAVAALTCLQPTALLAQALPTEANTQLTAESHPAQSLSTARPTPDLRKEERELAELESEANKQWIGLITSGSVGIVGIGLFLGGRDSAKQGIKNGGIALMTLGGTGALVTGMMLAAGASKRRRLELWMEARSLAKFHWDLRSGRFVF